jgi:ABC-type enterobactin transport system permease subunit
VRPWCFGAGDSDECDACWGEQERADALTAARSEGYAEAVADVVAWLMSDADSYANLSTKPERLPPIVAALRLAAAQIRDGAHVGAAKKGGVP